MFSLNRRGLFGATLGALTARYAPDIVKEESSLKMGYPTPYANKVGEDNIWRRDRILELKNQLLQLKPYAISTESQNLDALKSISPAVKDLLRQQRSRVNRTEQNRLRLIRELCGLGDQTYATPSVLEGDYDTAAPTPGQASQPY